MIDLTTNLQTETPTAGPPSYATQPHAEMASFWTLVRLCERLLAATALVLATPLLFAVLLVVRLISRRPPLVTHKRVGMGGRDLWVLKIRTMWSGDISSCPRGWIEPLCGVHVPISKSITDPRVTSPFAAFLRRHSIDELPQLWQVCTGELALIGPRPLTRAELAEHYGPSSERLLRSKPGVIGLTQVRGRDRLSYRQRRRLDCFLIDNWSIRMYVYLILAAARGVLTGRNAS